MDNNILLTKYKGLSISVRKSDGWVNLTQMCKANGKRLDNWLRLDQTKDYINSLTIEVVKNSPIETKEGRYGGTWGHPLLAINLARWIHSDFALWCDVHIFNLLVDGQTNLNQNPFERMNEILEERKQELNSLMYNDDRFNGVDDYSNWSK